MIIAMIDNIQSNTYMQLIFLAVLYESETSIKVKVIGKGRQKGGKNKK